MVCQPQGATCERDPKQIVLQGPPECEVHKGELEAYWRVALCSLYQPTEVCQIQSLPRVCHICRLSSGDKFPLLKQYCWHASQHWKKIFGDFHTFVGRASLPSHWWCKSSNDGHLKDWPRQYQTKTSSRRQLPWARHRRHLTSQPPSQIHRLQGLSTSLLAAPQKVSCDPSVHFVVQLVQFMFAVATAGTNTIAKNAMDCKHQNCWFPGRSPFIPMKQKPTTSTEILFWKLKDFMFGSSLSKALPKA